MAGGTNRPGEFGGGHPAGQGQPGYGSPQQGYGSHQHGYGAPQQGYGGPPPGYGAHQQGYGGPPPGYVHMPPAGGPYMGPDGPRSEKSGIALLLLHLLLGGWASNFYAGKIGLAILCLVVTIASVFTLMIFVGFIGMLAIFIWWVIDLINICTGKMRDPQGLPIKF